METRTLGSLFDKDDFTPAWHPFSDDSDLLNKLQRLASQAKNPNPSASSKTVDICFRCLGVGHWRRTCRDPIVCMKYKGTGHKAAACPLGKGKEEVPTNREGRMFLQLGDDFNPRDEERFLQCCVVVKARGWQPSGDEVAQAVGES
ncbi:hypothetical protein QJS10_CPA06g01142 [Acorus calamus]|uniref:CCHC-type domain-containing protein n=1 Tax=Acorus calamus TaxID=4465 RepID=A0AAV9EJV8_ACOCL|nr:hypothetical protein QJS10_CPA06g01142 [Acorus calamus]